MTTPHDAEARRRYLQGELDSVGTAPDGIIRVKFLALGDSKWLNLTAEQFEAIKKIIVPEPEPTVSYDPCITGKVEIEGAVSEFMLPLGSDSVGFSQWGADNETLWQRVDLLENLAIQAREWWSENRPGKDGDDD